MYTVHNIFNLKPFFFVYLYNSETIIVLVVYLEKKNSNVVMEFEHQMAVYTNTII